MKAVTFHGKRDVRVETVPDPTIQQPTDAIVRITSSGICGSDMPMMDLFDKQIQVRMGQANVKRWIDDILPLVQDEGDPLRVEDLASHKLPLDEAPHAYEIFQKKEDGAIKILLQP